MKKLTSLKDLKALMPDDYKSQNIIKLKSSIKKQTLEAHFSVKGRAGTPVTVSYTHLTLPTIYSV